MPGCPSVGIFVTWSNPASFSIRIVRSQPSVMPRFSAAMDGCRIHSCRRCTASSWRCSICVKMGVRSSGSAVASRGNARAAAAAAAVVSRNVLRSTLIGTVSRVMGSRYLNVAPSCGVAKRAAAYGVLRAASMNSVAPSEEAFVVTRISLFTLALVTLLGVVAASAQQRQITGRVTSAATTEPIAGVTVSVTGTALTALTNAEGRYAIAAPSGAVTLVFRRIAFKRRELQVPADQTAADATLEPDVFNLEAVVVTGQATGVERRNAAIATAVDRALQGRVPGAYIQQNSGAPGGGTQVQIRGSNTVVGSADPLFVVDG